MTEDDLKLVEQEKALLDVRGIGWDGGPRVLRSIFDATPKLVAEVRRLRKLVKDAEWFPGVGGLESEHGCPWCESDGFYSSSKTGHGKHFPECPAFTVDGEVR